MQQMIQSKETIYITFHNFIKIRSKVNSSLPLGIFFEQIDQGQAFLCLRDSNKYSNLKTKKSASIYAVLVFNTVMGKKLDWTNWMFIITKGMIKFNMYILLKGTGPKESDMHSKNSI